jgi:hypothetical protein
MTIAVEKFTGQPLPRQLGALAATLARVSACARWEKPGEAVPPMLSESIQFIEWIAPHAQPEVAAELVDMQVLLGLWRKSWPRAREDRTQSILLSLQAKKWADQVLDYSGLLEPAP